MNTKRFYSILFLVVFFLHSSFVSDTVEENNDDQFIVVLDAGHGGHDPGNLGNGYLEKDIALNIVLNVGAILSQNPKIKVVYTRDDDTFIDLYVRGEIANKANADLFVSVHCDSHTSDAYGAGTFVLGLHANKQNFEIAKKENSVIYLEDNYETRYADYDINSPESVIGLTIMQEEFLDQSISLAKTIQDNFSNKLKRKNREVKQAGFIVLHQTFMPSVLVETGFLTNDTEGAYLNSKKGQSEMGKAIADAILGYESGVQPNVVQTEEQINTSAPTSTSTPTPEKEMEKTKVVRTEKEAAEEFTKNPGESPVAQKAITEIEEVEEKLPEAINTSPKVAEVLKEQPKASVDMPVVKEEVMLPEKPKVAAVVKPEVVKPAIDVVEKKMEVIPSEKIEKPSAKTAVIVFKVQLMASTKSIPLISSKFNGLNKISTERFKTFYRYMYGSTNSYKEAKLLKTNADKKGYSSSYIVAYKDGVRIPTPQAIKMVSE